MMEKYNILNEDVYASRNIDDLQKIYTGRKENTPLAIVVCVNGEINFEINGNGYNVGPRQLIMLGAHTSVEKCCSSKDFKGSVLSL